ncbi:thiolase family protein [Natranaerofaba carboxydovora]|uniref:thiolase family protein n=1 Tax=Natranaerofaba carboxydovora TaxID=2742683 RepID=UPI001F1423C2|nr:acetyl-CoA C-acetyltransferase [Natranaerofaba carboxydovora]UMZ73427.1 Acetyl-CoA acetyltransferase [Natranaerofaba carboxydovora]
MQDVIIAEGVRTPIGDFGGQFKDLLANDLAVITIKEAMQRSDVNYDEVDEVILGNCIQRTDEPNLGRTAALKAGLPKETTGFTIQRQCSSGMQAAVSAYQEICLGDADIVIAGGAESMSNALYVLKGARFGQRMGHGGLTDSLLELLTDPIHDILMGKTAENLAEKYDITREEQDEISLRSHKNAKKATENGHFEEEIVPVPVPKKKGEAETINKDEHVRPDLTLDKLAKLPPVFKKDGTVTAGNASGVNDGATSLVMMSENKAKEKNIKPLGRIVSYAWAGVEPDLMGYGPVPATKKALEKAGLSLDDIELIEVNEAFAAQYLACEKLLELDRNIVNVNGSGVSLGHPVGSTGARIILTLLKEMHRRQNKYGLATLCVGGGMGMAVVVEKL